MKHLLVIVLSWIALGGIAQTAYQGYEFPEFASTAQPQTPAPARRPTQPLRQPDPKRDPGGYYDYCTSAAAYWQHRADSAILPAMLHQHNAAVQNATAYLNAAASVRGAAVAARMVRAPTRTAASSPGAKGVRGTMAGPKSLDDELPAPIMTHEQLQDPDVIAAWVKRLIELKIVTVLHIQRDEAQVDDNKWILLKLDTKRTIGVVMAYHLKRNGRTGTGMIVDDVQGRVLATFDLGGAKIMGAADLAM